MAARCQRWIDDSRPPLMMLSRHFIQFLRHLVQRILKIIHRHRHWIYFLLRRLIFLHQRLSSVWDVDQIDQTHDPVHHSNALLPQPCAPSTGRHPHFSLDTPNLRDGNQHVFEDLHGTSSTILDTPADPIDVAQAHRHSSPSHSLHHPLTGPPRTIGTSLSPGPSAIPFRSVGTHRTVSSFNSAASSGRASYRWHEGPTPPVRRLHTYGNHSAANSRTSLSSHITQSGLGASPRNNNEPGDSTERVEYPRFAQMVSSDVRRYQKNYSTWAFHEISSHWFPWHIVWFTGLPFWGITKSLKCKLYMEFIRELKLSLHVSIVSLIYGFLSTVKNSQLDGKQKDTLRVPFSIFIPRWHVAHILNSDFVLLSTLYSALSRKRISTMRTSV